MNFRPTVSHVWSGYIMWTGRQMISGRSLKQSISSSSTRVTRASPNSTSQVSAMRQLSWDTPGLWSTTPTSTGTQVKSNWHAAQITADRLKVIAATRTITSRSTQLKWHWKLWKGYMWWPQFWHDSQRQLRKTPPLPNSRRCYWHHIMAFRTCSLKSPLMNYQNGNNGTMWSALSQSPSCSVQKSIWCPRSSRRNLMTSSKRTCWAVTFIPQCLWWHPQSSSWRREMGNCDSSKIIKSSKWWWWRTPTCCPSYQTLSTRFQTPRPDTLQNWMYVGDTSMYKSKRETRGKPPSKWIRATSTFL